LKRLHWLLALSLIVSAVNSYADYEDYGVQYKCDAERSTISFAEYDEGSWFNLPVMPGYKVLTTGSHSLRCGTKLGVIQSTVNVVSGGNGMCRAGESVYIREVTVGSKNLLAGGGSDFNFVCPLMSDYFVSRLDVKLDARRATVRRCISDARPGPPRRLGCREESTER
jgi:hypothetical protein